MSDEHDTQQFEDDPEEVPASEETAPRPADRLDRLMNAKDKADKEAERWHEIEQKGTPVPSADRPGQVQVTQPSEPPEKPESEPEPPPLPPAPEETPTGQATPAKGAPPAPRIPEGAYLHPTDRPGLIKPPPPGQSGGPEDLIVEPPRPTVEEEIATESAYRPPSRRPQDEYEEPPEKLRDVRIDASGMPLPSRVPEEDPNATLVGDSAYRDDVILPPAEPTLPRGYPRPDFSQMEATEPHARPVPRQAPPAAAPPARRVEPRRRPRPRAKGAGLTWGCLLRVVMLTVIGGVVLLMIGGGVAAIYYARVTAPAFAGIEEITDLQARALQFETTRIRDREGRILYEINDPEGGRRDYIPLNEMSPYLIHATVATEERAYFTNPGFSIYDITRAVVQNFREGRTVSGASTITQQLTRALLLPEEERAERSYQRKIKEIFLAAELGRRFTKEEILELYLNQIPYGNLSYGAEAAALTYFDKSARDLSLAEASFIAGLPQSPAIYDPVTNKEAALLRQGDVLYLMIEAGCIDTGSTGLALPCITEADIVAAAPELEAVAIRDYHLPDLNARYPHWVVYVQRQLEANPAIGPSIYTSGFDVYTTLDPRLQDLAQEQVELALSGLTDRNVNNASVVVIDIRTGAILAMVGSRDFDDETIDGQVNIALTPQQPGSSIKPFTYLAAFRQGWTPATVIWDVPISYEIPGFGAYEPVNYDERFRGPVTVRQAIANSLNVPAILTLDHVGVPALLEVLNDVGITSLGDPTNPNSYGLSLTLGAGEVYLLEWTNAFATIGNGGRYRPPYAIERIEKNGQVIEGYPYEVPEGEQVINPAHAYLMQNIMSDKVARIPSFGANSPISPEYPAGAKTGTTNDFRDNWTMGYTTEIAVGVWVGNTDNTPMINVTGVTGAGPIWRGVMDGSQQWYPAQQFPRPPGVFDQTVCKDDGAIPSQFCLDMGQSEEYTSRGITSIYTEIFSLDVPPPDASQSIYRPLRVDNFTGLIANDYCPNFAEDKFFIAIPNPSQLIDVPGFARQWLVGTAEGQAWLILRGLSPDDLVDQPPTESCGPDTPIPEIFIDAPLSGSTQSGILTVYGTADAPNFSHYIVDFGLGPDPLGWGSLQGVTPTPVHNSVLGQMDLTPFGNGQMTIKLTVFDTAGHSADVRVTFNMQAPTPEPEEATPIPPPPTDTPTPPVTETPVPEPTEEPTVETPPTETPVTEEPTPEG